jgi:large repetitive protein
MSRKTLFGAVAGAMLFLTVGVSTAAAAPVPLLLPQSNAFTVLGHSCGGIQEQVYATGFDPASGYPTGDVYLSTRCGGSGRGGGYHTTTYSAWAGVTWDFTTAVLSSGALSSAPRVDPGFSAFDANGNQLYNQSNNAYLVLAPGFVPAARVTAVSPGSGPAAGGTSVSIAGTGFTGATAVSFGGAAARSFTVNSDSSITAVSPAEGAGTVDVTVANSGGTSITSASDRFTFVAIPSVSSLSPKSGSVAGGTEVTITGTGLAAATQVTFGGTPAGFWVNSDTSITAISPAAEAAGTASVRVTSLGGRSATGAGSRFTFVVTTPVVAGVDPSTGPADGGTWVTISGANLSGAGEVDFGGIPAEFWVNDDSSITALSPAASPGAVDVTVTTFGRTSATSSADQFTYTVSTPAVSSVDPADGPVGGGMLVTIYGSGFTSATEVDFGGVPADFSVNDDGSIIAVSPAGTAGTVDVTVTNGGGTSDAGSGDQFTYVAAPTVASVDPSSGTTEGGTAVTISGSGFTGATEVDFGGVPADFSVNDDGSITAISPAGSAGAVDVTVTTSGGTSAASADDQFTYG